jgi:hypothetical protein
MTEGSERFISDKGFELDRIYKPYPYQDAFHKSPAPYAFLGGAAGPGKTSCGLMEQFIACNMFSGEDGPRVSTLSLRRTYPKLNDTVITRARELFPPELYRKFVMGGSSGHPYIEWRNGARTVFGAMQHEADAWNFQGQWFHIYYDELCEFAFKQWNATSAWNRCPVSPYTRKYGSGNPIGVGAHWVHQVFVKHQPCEEMDEEQRKAYRAEDYPYFHATYRDNPIYANDPRFLQNLMSYDEGIREALKEGKWGVAGGFFVRAWDEEELCYDEGEEEIQRWHKRWLSADWGYEHPSAIYKHAMRDDGDVLTYDELLVKHLAPEDLGNAIAGFCEPELKQGIRFQSFALSHDAFATNTTKSYGADSRPVATRMASVIREAGLPDPHNSGRDKLGREQLMLQLMTKRLPIGENTEIPAWKISRKCRHLIEVIPRAPRDELNVEVISAFLGDDPLQGAGYGLYTIFGRPRDVPKDVQLQRVLADAPDNTALAMRAMRFEQNWKKTHPEPRRSPVRWRR